MVLAVGIMGKLEPGTLRRRGGGGDVVVQSTFGGGGFSFCPDTYCLKIEVVGVYLAKSPQPLLILKVCRHGLAITAHSAPQELS